MSAVVVVGAQWGDEGKGKIVDILSERADVVVRFQGGNNAGHTLVVGEETTVLHLVPSGVLHPGTVCVIGNGVVVDPAVLLEELDTLQARGYLADPQLLKISDRAHLIMPYHRAIDQAREKLRGEGRIGTTGRGIGPTYEDKMARIGIRLADLADEEALDQVLRRTITEKNAYLRDILKAQALDYEAIREQYAVIRPRLLPHIVDANVYLDEVLSAGRRVLFEGAQGTMLDVDNGTYPYVTSSNCVAGAVATGGGVAPGRIDHVVGITKAYTTRVGSGPFPTELDDDIGKRLREEGAEFGATTGRPRRCGWFDGVVARHARRINGLSSLAITKLDVLTGISPLRLCVAYELDGKRIEHVPAAAAALQRARPVYEELPGWTESISEIRSIEDLPANARRYLERIEQLAAAPIHIVSVGARRRDTIMLHNPFAS